MAGVLYAESPQDLRFRFEDEDALVVLSAGVAQALHASRRQAAGLELATDAAAPGKVCTVRHYGADDSVFLDDDYLIKGVAGAIFYRLAKEYAEKNREEFSNRELRLDPGLGLPDVTRVF